MRRDQVTTSLVEEKVSGDRIYRLLNVSIPEVTSKTRRKLLSRIVEGKNIIGSIEWWARGSVVSKPSSDFQIIVVIEKH